MKDGEGREETAGETKGKKQEGKKNRKEIRGYLRHETKPRKKKFVFMHTRTRLSYPIPRETAVTKHRTYNAGQEVLATAATATPAAAAAAVDRTTEQRPMMPVDNKNRCVLGLLGGNDTDIPVSFGVILHLTGGSNSWTSKATAAAGIV